MLYSCLYLYSWHSSIALQLLFSVVRGFGLNLTGQLVPWRGD